MADLLIDDERTLPVDRIVRTYDEGIDALAASQWDTLYLDHDLGDTNDRKTGYGIICWLEQHPEHLPKKVILVTMNPAGRRNMELALGKLYPGERNFSP